MNRLGNSLAGVLPAFILLVFALLLSGCAAVPAGEAAQADAQGAEIEIVSDTQAQAGGVVIFSDDPYIVMNENVPEFTEDEITKEPFAEYEDLDSLGRCRGAFACVGTERMPSEEQGDSIRFRPTGWHRAYYDSLEGQNLYICCHLIAYELTGGNADERNLITAARYMYEEGMLPFERMVADYVKETGNHVMYRVTPEFEGDNLAADGVQMEALSVEDNGEGISYNVFIYNIQPGFEIDYATGDSYETEQKTADTGGMTYVLDKNTMEFHLPSCSIIHKIENRNRENFTGEREKLIEDGYEPCESCNP